MTTEYQSHLKEFNRMLRSATAEGLRRAAIFTHAQCRLAVGKSAGPTPKKRKRDTTSRGGGAAGSQYTVYISPSKPGEPPHKRTGLGQSNIIWESNDNRANPAVRVGVKKAGMHMALLELGTVIVKARPWLLKTILDKRRRIGMLAATGGRHLIK